MSAVLGVGLVIGVILAHDAFTYSDKHVDRVPCNPLSLHPRRGGKKDLPIIEVNLDAEEAEKKSMGDKPRLVIIGGGWGVSDCSVFLTFTTYPSFCSPLETVIEKRGQELMTRLFL